MAMCRDIKLLISIICHVSLCTISLQQQFMYSASSFDSMYNHNRSICLRNRQWYLHRDLGSWKFSHKQMLSSSFPLDKESKNYVRKVHNAVFSVVMPTPMKKAPFLAAVNEEVLTSLLDMESSIVSSSRFLKFVSGNELMKDSIPLAHRYGGYQFGYWSGQLGDGRAVMLGEYVNSAGERWELQLKGSGLTPYSRQGDGRAVIRSSVREFLASEAMHALGVPTSRSVSLVVSDDPVIRDQFYNGNVQRERAAVVLRLAKTWFRIGSLEILMMNDETKLLKRLVDFIIVNYFESINSTSSDRYLEFFQEVCLKTAHMIALWQSIGFTNGVCNTDNFSILSITIDYGPFGFMEEYNPGFVPNTSDDEGRYRYEAQPEIGLFNLEKLFQSLIPLLDKKQIRQSKQILKGFTERYKFKFMESLLQKLGLQKIEEFNDDDEQLVAILLKIMEDTKADFTMTFREMSELSLNDLKAALAIERIDSKYWALEILLNHEWFPQWLKLYERRLTQEHTTDITRQKKMLGVNPRYVLRNWIAQTAIAKAEKNDFKMVTDVLHILQRPFTFNKLAEEYGFASPPPSWAKQLKVSCSS